MSIENPTLAHFRHFSSLFTLSPLYICREHSTNQLLFMQNKPNLLDAQMNVNIYYTKVYKNETTFRPQKNKPKQTQFHLPPSGKTEVRCRTSEFRYLSSAFCFLSSVHNHQALTVGFAGLIHVNTAGCPFYHFNGLGYLVQLWDLEYFATLKAVYPSVRGTAIKQPSTATSRALGDNLHQYIPYTKSRIIKKEHLLELIETQNILPTESIVIHQKFPFCPIISPERKLLRFRHKKPGSEIEIGEIFLDLHA